MKSLTKAVAVTHEFHKGISLFVETHSEENVFDGQLRSDLSLMVFLTYRER